MSNDKQADAMVAVKKPEGALAPLVFDSPHSGSLYPDDFGAAVSLDVLQHGEDRFVDELVAEAPQHGVTLIAARFARTYLDPNRRLDDLDEGLLDAPWPHALAPTINSARGVGLIFGKIDPDISIYDRKLSVEEVHRRIELCWRPYHDALQEAVDGRHARNGEVWHINWHSMSGVGTETSPDPGKVRPDFVLGDLDGRSCKAAFTEFVTSTLEDMGYSIAVNDPYKGAELVERHGRPDEGRHSLQIEINRNLYMDRRDLEKHDGFDVLRRDLGRLTGRICDYCRSP